MIKKISLWSRVASALLFAVTTITYFPVSNANADSVSWTSGGQPTAGSIVETKDNLYWCQFQKEMVYNQTTPQDVCIAQGESVRFGYLTSSGQPLLSLGSDEVLYPFSGAPVLSWDGAKLIPGTDILLVRDYMATYTRGLSIFKNLSNKVVKNGSVYVLDSSQASFTLKRSDNSLIPVNFLSYSSNGEWIVMNTEAGTIRMNVQNYDLHVFAESSGGNTVYLSISDDGEHAVRLIHGTLARVYDIDVSCGSADITQTLNLSQSCPSADFSSLISAFGNDNYIWPSTISFSPDNKMVTVYYWVQAEGQYKFVDIYVPGYSPVDMDDDELTLAQETTQGTSDNIKDTDGDGLRDDIESRWNLNRDNAFCGSQCAYPNPTKKDIYVQVDWMKEDSSSGRSFIPSNSQLDSVKSAFAFKNINIHFDTGQYGGGNELTNYIQDLYFESNSSEFDFYDYKNGTSTTPANFNSDRYKIWHYMISGYQYHDIPGSSGVSYKGDDDFFISTGLIKDSQSSFGYLGFDQALSGTIIHELGHNLCLSSTTDYLSHSSECVYTGIDSTNASPLYVSSMNYSYQMFMTDYSDGSNSPSNDHDDWNAVNTGMKDFVTNTSGDSLAAGTSKTSKKFVKGISIAQAKELRKKNKLGKNNINYFTHYK